jgi:hypothetical protein
VSNSWVRSPIASLPVAQFQSNRRNTQHIDSERWLLFNIDACWWDCGVSRRDNRISGKGLLIVGGLNTVRRVVSTQVIVRDTLQYSNEWNGELPFEKLID